MRRLLLISGTLAAVLVGVACGRQAAAPTADEAWETAKAAIEAAGEGNEEAIRILRGYLEQYPVTRRTSGLLGWLVDLEAVEAGLPADTEALVRSIWPQLEDADERFELDKLLVKLAALQRDSAKLEVALGNVTADRTLTFNDRLELMEGLVAGEAWSETLGFAELAGGQATAEAYRADNPETELTDEEVAAAATRRRVLAESYRGWALANLGLTEDALAAFASVAADAERNYAGVPQDPLFKWWGATALEAGDAERALELLAPDAVMGGDDAAMADLRRAYAARFGTEAGLDDYLWATRDRLAKPVEGFTLTDYEGREVALESFNGKVVLLAFWFPT